MVYWALELDPIYLLFKPVKNNDLVAEPLYVYTYNKVDAGPARLIFKH